MGCTESKDPQQLRVRVNAKQKQTHRTERERGSPQKERSSPRRPTYFSPPRDVDRLYGTTEYDGASRCSPRPPLRPQLRKTEHPTELVEVALQLQGVLAFGEGQVAELLDQFHALCTVVGVSAADCTAAAARLGAAGCAPAAEELLPFALRRLLPLGHGRVCFGAAEAALFATPTRAKTTPASAPAQGDAPGTPIKVSEGCVIEGTAAAEHFVISGNGGSVVTGGAGSDVFMFMPSPDPSPEKPHTLTDFDPQEDVIDLRALPIKALKELSIDPHHHQHCRIQGPHFDVILIGVTVEQLVPEHFILPAPGAGGPTCVSSPPLQPLSSLPRQKSWRSPIVVEAGETRPGSPRPETYLIEGAGTTLVSGPESDVFVFLPRAGGTRARPHTIVNFKVGGGGGGGTKRIERCDKLDLRGLGLPCWSDLRVSEEVGHLLGRGVGAGSGCAIVCGGAAGGGDASPAGAAAASLCVRLPGVRASELRAEHFVFGTERAEGAGGATPHGDGGELSPTALPIVIAWLACRAAAATGDAAAPPAGTGCAPFPAALCAALCAGGGGGDDAEWLRRLPRGEGQPALARLCRLLRGAVDRAFRAQYEGVAVAVDPRTVFRARPRRIAAPPPRDGMLLPPPRPTGGDGGRRRYTVVLDLDETLVYSRHVHTTQKLCIRHGVHDLFVLLRQFGCEVVMWSAADAETVNAIWAAVDPTGVTSHVLPREVWQRGPRDVGKDLSRLGRDLASVIMFDNTPLAVEGWATNAVVVRDYLGGPHPADRVDELYGLASLLRQLCVSGRPVPEFLAAAPKLARVRLFRKNGYMDFNVLHHCDL